MRTLAILVILATLAIVLTFADECQKGETKKIDCNDCTCTNGNWACTRKACHKLTTRQTRCTPGETFMEDCNTCICSPDGRTAACTLMACLPV